MWQFIGGKFGYFRSVLVAHDCIPAIGGQEQGMV